MLTLWVPQADCFSSTRFLLKTKWMKGLYRLYKGFIFHSLKSKNILKLVVRQTWLIKMCGVKNVFRYGLCWWNTINTDQIFSVSLCSLVMPVSFLHRLRDYGAQTDCKTKRAALRKQIFKECKIGFCII